MGLCTWGNWGWEIGIGTVFGRDGVWMEHCGLIWLQWVSWSRRLVGATSRRIGNARDAIERREKPIVLAEVGTQSL